MAQPKEAAPPGRLIPFDGRKVHLFCEGESHGAPTVIIEVGSSTPARVWRGVQDNIAAFDRVCAYDRAGYGWSDPEPRSRTMLQRAQEYHAVLQAAGERGPYVVLAHSYGGLLMRLFTRQYPDEVLGLVLVDSAEEGQMFSAMAHWDALGPELKDLYDKAVAARDPDRINFYAAIRDELASDYTVPPAMMKIGGFGRLGDRPLVVIVHAKPFIGEDAVLEPQWRAAQERLAALSSRGRLVVATRSDHNVEVSEPDLIVDAVKDVLAQARERQPRG